MNALRLILVRHGETTGQSSIRYFGRTDVPLSELGIQQMRRVGDALRTERFDAVFSSRLARSRDGAALVAGKGHHVCELPAFDEVDFGRWEGWTREEIEERDPENYRRWRAESSTFTYPGGESRPAFEARVVAGMQALVASLSVERVLMVLHRGVIAVLLTELLRLEPSQRASLGIDLASIHVVLRNQGEWSSGYLNRIDHLVEERESRA